MKPLVTWIHTDGRRIVVYQDYKVRYSGRAHARSVMRPGDTADEWPILYRRDVPNLTDADWQAVPAEDGWTREDS